MALQQVLIAGEWANSIGEQTFFAVNPATREPLPETYPVSPWKEVERAIDAASAAFQATRGWSGERFAAFLERYADRIDARSEEIIQAAHLETGLPIAPRLKVAELPRTVNQLRQAASAARSGSWSMPTIDSAANIRSIHAALGPVVVFGPNNFPFAFNGISGGDFAAAVAAGNPVIAKGHSSHPTTTRLLAEEALAAARETSMPDGFVQLIYRTSHADGAKLVSHSKMGAVGYTGARATGLVLKEAADKVGKPIYLELSSINPVCILPGVLEERGEATAADFTSSCLMGAGQFCTNPGLVLLLAGPRTEEFVQNVAGKFQQAPVGTMLSEGVLKSFTSGISTIVQAGAKVLTGGSVGGGTGICHQNTLLRVDGKHFLEHAEALQTEAFGNASLIVIAQDEDELLRIIETLEGNLTGTIYSAQNGTDEPLYRKIEPALRIRVGRLINDKMPTGVAVSSAMNHGGPFPATGHPGFTAVGIPASIRRFSMLQCFDNVPPHRLPPLLQNRNPNGMSWRLIDGNWTQSDVESNPKS